MNENQIIDMLGRYLSSGRWWMCPNVMVGHNEVDLLAVSKRGWAYEWEIKCSLSDWKADLKKGLHGEVCGRSPGIAYFNYLVHDAIVPDDLSWVPSYCGIVTVNESGRLDRIKNPKKIAGSKVWDKSEIWRLCYYRYWALRDKHNSLVKPLQDKLDRVNDSLQALVSVVDDQFKAPSLLLPAPWKRSNGALEKRKDL